MIPTFRVSSLFVDEIPATCLEATIRNSQIPGMAYDWIAEKGTDPQCKVYLRTSKHQELSSWSRDFLESIFNDGGLSTIVEQCFVRYRKLAATNTTDFQGEGPEETRNFKCSSYVVVSMIVLDEWEKEVVVAMDTEIDPYLDEHGFVIFWKNSEWHFGYGDYFADYIARVRNEQKLAALRTSDVPSLEAVEPSLFGVWGFDERVAARIFEDLQFPKSNRDLALRIFRGIRLVISGTGWVLETGRSAFGTVNKVTYEVTGQTTQDDRIEFSLTEKPPGVLSTTMFYRRGVLFDLDGRVFSRLR